MPIGIRLGPVRIGLSDRGVALGARLGPLTASTTVPRRQRPDGSLEIAYPLDGVVRLLVDQGYRIDGRDVDWALLVRGRHAVRLEAAGYATRAREVMAPAVQIGLAVGAALVVGAIIAGCFAAMFYA